MTDYQNQKTRALKLFSTDADEVGNRFSLIGDRSYRVPLACPITPLRARVLFDSISENRILRMTWSNVSGAIVTAVTLSVTSRDNRGRELGSVSCDFLADGDGNTLGYTYGIPLSEGVTNGSVTVERVIFSDGLAWSKGSLPTYFTTEDKTAYDLDDIGVN